MARRGETHHYAFDATVLPAVFALLVGMGGLAACAPCHPFVMHGPALRGEASEVRWAKGQAGARLELELHHGPCPARRSHIIVARGRMGGPILTNVALSSDEDGKAVVLGLPPDTYTLLVNFRNNTDSFEIEIPADTPQVHLHFDVGWMVLLGRAGESSTSRSACSR